MILEAVFVRNFRSYREKLLELDDGVTIISGPNGSGKTNLLEAAQVVFTGSSFRGDDQDLIQLGQDEAKIEGSLSTGRREVILKIKGEGSIDKRIVLDGVSKSRLMQRQKLPIVLFEPDHLRLLTDSPARRRQYIDLVITNLLPEYSRIRHQFERSLQQRNNILKTAHGSTGTLEDQLFVWNIKFAELAEKIVRRRVEVLSLINEELSATYSRIAATRSEALLRYNSAVELKTYKIDLLQRLERNLTIDLQRGYTSVGPHREDFTAFLNGNPAATTASRGEMRTLLLSMKICELELLRTSVSHAPLLLLDDVFSELDSTRRSALAELSSKYQTIITTTDADIVARHLFSTYSLHKTTER